MKKKNIFILSIVLCISFSSGCSSAPAVSEIPEIPKTSETLSDAEVIIPSALIGEEIAQAGTEIAATDNGDGTVTYSLSGTQRADILNTIAANLEESIQSILEDDDYYPDITAITANNDCTTFTISLKDGQMNIYESMLVMSFYTIGNKYQIYNGVPSEQAVTTVIYINSTDNTIISETDSTSMETFSS